MKRNLIIIFALLAVFTACRKNLSDINVDNKSASQAPGSTLFSAAQKSFSDILTTPNVNQNIFEFIVQYWAATTYPQESRYDIGNRNIPQNWWTVIYRDVIRDLNESLSLIRAEPQGTEVQEIARQNRIAIVKIVRTHAYYVLVNTFGNIPYTQAMNIEDPTPAYDDQREVYMALLDTLNASINELDPSEGSFGSADLVYRGDVEKWFKFANSLKLRMAMVLADVDYATAKTLAEEAAPNVFTSNDDNAVFQYLSTPPNTNPIWTNLVQSNRNDFVPANTLVNAMNDLDDPRREFYFTTDPNGGYSGGIYGSGNTFANFSHASDKVLEPDLPSVLMDYAEVEFLLAEAVERGMNVGGTAEEHYINAVTASITFWGGSDADAAAYLAQAEVDYSSAPGSWEQKIGTQQWIAFYLRGFDAWTVWRRLDYPQLQAPASAITPIPVRYTYPSNEQNLNQENYAKASADIGGDAVTTNLFWDVD
jgi:hypothetical protein